MTTEPALKSTLEEIHWTEVRSQNIQGGHRENKEHQARTEGGGGMGKWRGLWKAEPGGKQSEGTVEHRWHEKWGDSLRIKG